MSRRSTMITGICGALLGALAGIPYLIGGGGCSDVGPESVQCALNQTVGPFLSAIAIGIVIAITAGTVIAAITKRSLAPKGPDKEQPPDAVEIDDPAIQIAAWGMPPGASQRTVSLSDPVAYRSRKEGSAAATPRRAGAGYGAARSARAGNSPPVAPPIVRGPV